MRIDPHPDGWREPGNLMDQSDARSASARVGAVPGLNQQMFRIVWLTTWGRRQLFGDALDAMNTAEVYESWPPFGLANRVSPLSSCCEAKGCTVLWKPSDRTAPLSADATPVRHFELWHPTRFPAPPIAPQRSNSRHRDLGVGGIRRPPLERQAKHRRS